MLKPLLHPYRGIPRLIWKLLTIQFLMNAGHFMAIPLLAVHLNSNLDLGAASLGTVLTVHLLAARLLPGITGPLADWLGARGLMIAGLAFRAVGLFGVAYLGSLWGLCFMVFLMGAGTSLYESAVYGVFGRQPKNIAPKVFVINNQTLNAGVILGPLVGSLLALISTEYAFISSGLVFAALTLWIIGSKIVRDVEFEDVPIWQSVRTVLSDRAFGKFFLATLPWWFLFTQLYVVFPIYIADIGGSIAYTGTMYVVNGVVGLVLMFVSIIVFEKVRARRILTWCYLSLVLIYLLVPMSDLVWWFLVVVGLYTIAETLILPAMETVTAELAVEGSQSTYFGAASLSWAIAGTAGNYVGSWLVLEASPEVVWFVFSAVAMVGVLLSMCLGSYEARLKVA